MRPVLLRVHLCDHSIDGGGPNESRQGAAHCVGELCFAPSHQRRAFEAVEVEQRVTVQVDDLVQRPLLAAAHFDFHYQQRGVKW